MANAKERVSVPETANNNNDSTIPVAVSTDGKMKLVNRFTINDLTAIQNAFFVNKNEDETELSLDKEQFCGLLSIVLNKGSQEDYCELFDKADVNKEGLVDWDKLCSHLLLQFYEKDDRMKTTQVPQWLELKYIACPHKDAIDKLAPVGSPTKQYVTVSREGTVAFWSLEMKLTRTLHVHTNPEEIKPRDLWVTHFTPMSHINKLALALTSKEIAIYDLSSKTEFNCQYKIYGLTCTPICLDYWSNPHKSGHSILSYGDTGGNVHVIVFSNAAIALFERPLQPAGSKQEACLLINIHEVAKCTYQYARYYQHSCHSEWVRKLQYAPTLDCFISCSTTSTNSMTLGWLEKGTTNMRTNMFSVLQGLNSFDYNPELNLIATAGINTQVCLWNPYVISKPVGILQGHMQSVIAVNFIQNKSQLISLSKEKVLRIWDTHLQVCLQRLSGMFPKVNDAVVSIYFDSERSRLFATFNNQLTLLCMKSEIKDRIISHENAVTALVYNKVFNQVVTVCTGSVITMWMVRTGQKVKQFANAHGTSEITCLTQDPLGMRLLTGSTDGTIKIWDFNGQCHHILMAGNGNPCEINQIMYLKKAIIAVGWDRTITCFPTTSLKSFYVYPIDWKGRHEHEEDIVYAAFNPPRTLATGSFDGDIVLWNVITESSSRHLSCKKTQLAREKSARSHSKVSTSHSSRAAARYSNQLSVSDDYDDQSNTMTSCSVACLLYLTARPGPTTSSGGANLVSCTNSGLVVFWNTFSSVVSSEFVAHDQAGTLTMATDEENKYLVTGDSEGCCKVWHIESYCQRTTVGSIDKEAPPLRSTFTPHSDAINCINVLILNKIFFVVTASSDCCASMHTIDGSFIGTFGQEQHWNIEKVLRSSEHDKSNSSLIVAGEGQDDKVKSSPTESTLDNKAGAQSERRRTVAESNSLLEIAVPKHCDVTNDSVDLESRIHAWDKTILGKIYQQRGNEKQERKQPYTLPYINVERGQNSISAFQALTCNDLTEVPTLFKPDFVFHPERYFRNTADQVKSEELPSLPPIVDSLHQRHDEKSLFPKSVLEDMKLKTATFAFSSYPRHGKISNAAFFPGLSKTFSSGMPASSKSNRTGPDTHKESAKDKKSNVWNKKILSKIKGSIAVSNEISETEENTLKSTSKS
eukprot:gene2980-3435_t